MRNQHLELAGQLKTAKYDWVTTKSWKKIEPNIKYHNAVPAVAFPLPFCISNVVSFSFWLFRCPHSLPLAFHGRGPAEEVAQAKDNHFCHVKWRAEPDGTCHVRNMSKIKTWKQMTTKNTKIVQVWTTICVSSLFFCGSSVLIRISLNPEAVESDAAVETATARPRKRRTTWAVTCSAPRCFFFYLRVVFAKMLLAKKRRFLPSKCGKNGDNWVLYMYATFGMIAVACRGVTWCKGVWWAECVGTKSKCNSFRTETGRSWKI